jgi:hypothetical protein
VLGDQGPGHDLGSQGPTRGGALPGLVSNREIGMAIGVLMTSCRITDQQAFDMLRPASRHHHRKLRDVPAEVVLTGELPVDVPRVATERPRPSPALLRPRAIA